MGCRGLLLPRPARVSYIYQNAARKLVSPLENWEAARASTGIIQGRSLCGSAGGVYFKMKVKTEKVWTFCPAPVCDRTQIAHFHEKQLLAGTGCLNKLVYSGRVLSLSRHLVVQKKRKQYFCAAPSKHKFKEMSVAALEKRFAGKPCEFCDIPVPSLCFSG